MPKATGSSRPQRRTCEDERDIGTCRIGAKILERPAHVPEIAVRFRNNLESERAQRLVDGLGIIDSVAEGAKRLVFIDAENQCHSPLGGCRNCHHQHKNCGKHDARHGGRPSLPTLGQ